VGLAVIFGAKWLFHWDDVAANLLGYGVGIVVGFVVNKRWTFTHAGAAWPAWWRYVVVLACAYLVNLGAVLFLIHVLKINSYYAQVGGIFPYTLLGYLGSRYFAFRRPVAVAG
jgi:putative flippase GtrA